MKITHYLSVKDDNSPVVAIVNFYIEEWGLHLNDCRYIRKKNGGFFVGYPSKRVEKENQDAQYFPYFNFDKQKNERFQSAAQKAIDQYIREGGKHESKDRADFARDEH